MLEVRQVEKSFINGQGLFKKKKKQVLKGVSLCLKEGECLGIIGESGSGKSTLGKIILGMEKADKGTIAYKGSTSRKDWQKEMSVVFQDYTSSVNPRFTVAEIIAEPLLGQKLSKVELKAYSVNLLEQVGLDENYLKRLPHELSGGQLQRVCIARAIANKPKVIVLDEAISSLDVSVQVQILDLLVELKKRYQLSYLFITHDLTAVTYMCDRVIFFKEGQIIEEVEEINQLGNVKEAYSRSLLEAVMDIEMYA